ncbi:BRCA1-A complex subunit RAP80 isoform X2 [Scleropages formosus]|uniref:BRCA1-A complex subunit RAP80 isoform X2 n=1 Tax=Scleropages formosus TaxID=113540 RepID=UPI000878DDC1|nr:BRCA1-A complex subunit RAP80 isoform X2 [Scleropages formosus]
MPRKKRARPKGREEEDERDVPQKRRHDDDDDADDAEDQTVFIGDSEEEEEEKSRDRKPGMLDRDYRAQGPEMTEEEMFNLAMKLSEEEAKNTAMQQQQEDEAIKIAIAESLHANGIQPDNRVPKLVALTMGPGSVLSSDHESFPVPESSVFPARKKSLRFNQSKTLQCSSHRDSVTTVSTRKKKQPNSALTQRSELHLAGQAASSLSSAVSEKEKSFSQKKDPRSQSPHQDVQDASSCQSQLEGNIFGPMRTSPPHRPIICIAKLSQDLVEDCQATGYILCSQKLSGCLESSQTPTLSQQDSPSPSESPTFPRMDLRKDHEVAKSESEGVSQEYLCLETIDDSESLLSRVKTLSLSRRQILKEQTPGGKNSSGQVHAGFFQGGEEVHHRTNVHGHTGEEPFHPLTDENDEFCTQMELHWSDDDDDDEEEGKALVKNTHRKLKTYLIRGQGSQSAGTGVSCSSDLDLPTSPVFPQDALQSMGPQGTMPAKGVKSVQEAERKPTAVPSGRALTGTVYPPPVVDGHGSCAVRYYWGVPFCPRGLDPDNYTRAILTQLEVYEKSLKEARRGLLRKAAWGDPVLPGPAEVPPCRRGRPKRFRALRQLPDEDEDDGEDEDEEENEDTTTSELVEVVEVQESTGSPQVSKISEQKMGETQDDDALRVPSPLSKRENFPMVRKPDFSENLILLRKGYLRCRGSAVTETQEIRDEEEDLCPETELSDENTPELMVQSPEQSKVKAAEPECTDLLDEQQVGSGPAQEAGSEQTLQQQQEQEEHVDTGTEEVHGNPEVMECPICMHAFPLEQIEMHAAYCDGSPEDLPLVEELSTQVRSQRRSSRRVEVLDDNQPTSSSSGKTQKKERCYICRGTFPISEYERHVDDCLCHRTSAANKGAKNLLVALDQSEQKGSAGPSDSRWRKRGNSSCSPVDGSEASEEAPTTAFQVRTSPIRAFTPISEITDCLIDFKNQYTAKPSQRRGRRKKFK